MPWTHSTAAQPRRPTHLAEPAARGITAGDRTVLDYFEPIVRYRRIARDAV